MIFNIICECHPSNYPLQLYTICNYIRNGSNIALSYLHDKIKLGEDEEIALAEKVLKEASSNVPVEFFIDWINEKYNGASWWITYIVWEKNNKLSHIIKDNRAKFT